MQLISYHADLKDWAKLVNTECPIGIIYYPKCNECRLIYLSCKEGWYSFDFEYGARDGSYWRSSWKLSSSLPTIADWNEYLQYDRPYENELCSLAEPC